MFEWLESMKEFIKPGQSICVENSPNYPDGRYDVIGKINGFILIKLNGVGASVPWHRCNPNSLLY